MEKVRLTQAHAQAWRDGTLCEVGCTKPPSRPARPPKPLLCRPGDLPKRSTGLGKRRTALVHAIAHIELNAIDLAWDAVARFADVDLPRAYFDDWVQVAEDEARHFEMLSHRLGELGAAYGDMPAHDGLWEVADDTAHDVLARLALVPMVLEARGLDTTPAMETRLRENGDRVTADLLATIAADEIGHVAAGVRWFEHLCAARGVKPISTFKTCVTKHFKGKIKPPFNQAARDQACMNRAYYEP